MVASTHFVKPKSTSAYSHHRLQSPKIKKKRVGIPHSLTERWKGDYEINFIQAFKDVGGGYVISANSSALLEGLNSQKTLPMQNDISEGAQLNRSFRQVQFALDKLRVSDVLLRDYVVVKNGRTEGLSNRIREHEIGHFIGVDGARLEAVFHSPPGLDGYYEFILNNKVAKKLHNHVEKLTGTDWWIMREEFLTTYMHQCSVAIRLAEPVSRTAKDIVFPVTSQKDLAHLQDMSPSMVTPSSRSPQKRSIEKKKRFGIRIHET